jgi:hypothetical protein
VVCLFVHGVAGSIADWVFIENNYLSLFPGEEAEFTVIPIRGKPEERGLREIPIVWRCFNG